MEMIGDSTNPDAAIIPRIKDGIGPDDIRLNARLVRVIAPVPAFTAYPCSRYPCLADIEIIEILARGRTYQGVATQGQVLRAFFPMTLISSDVVFTEKKSLAYPGLSEGSVFQADLTGAASLSEPGEVQHTVISYSIIR